MAKWGAGRRRTGRLVVAAAIGLPLFLGSCVDQPRTPDPASFAPSSNPGSSPAAQPAPAAPAPQRQDPPPAGASATTPAAVPTSDAPKDNPPTRAPQGLAVPEAGHAKESPVSPAPPPTSEPVLYPAAPRMLTAYYVLLDDGGNSGVRFGCNDSLVGLARVAPGSGPLLNAAMDALLGGASDADVPLDSVQVSDVYDALANSELTFLSGSFDGTTVTVYLAGTLSLGGVCDIPRVEAQLTQTAVAAAGAIRAEIYVNGRTLTDVLRQD